VVLSSGVAMRIDELSVGDRVHVGHGCFSEVFMFTHRVADIHQQFISIESSSGARLRATAGHYLYVNGGLGAVGSVTVGDEIELGYGVKDVVTKVTVVAGQGLYNPQTVNGDIVVDGIRASTYTTAVDPVFAHAILAPLRAAYNTLGCYSSSLEKGWGFRFMVPSGSASSSY
jgi:Hint module